MAKDTIKPFELQPPIALRPKTRASAGELIEQAAVRLPRTKPPLKPIILGSVCALALGFVANIGPWHTITATLLGTADAQEAPPRVAPGTAVAEPSEADRAALRYFARQGDVDRLEAELRRLRALYPGWQPPRDLLDPQGQDTELQRIYDLVGNQQYDEAQRAIAERQQRDPSFQPPERLTALIELGRVRAQLRQVSDRGDFNGVLRLAQENERILTCDDVDSIWRVAQAFARTGRPERAYDAYAYVINTCPDAGAKAASLQKAATELDPSYITRLFAIDNSSAELTSAELDIIRGAIARGGDVEGTPIPEEWLDELATAARTGTRLEDAMLIGYYLYRQGLPQPASDWFRFALDSGLGADAAEGYIIALRATGNREDEFLAREVAYQWREQTPELMEAYLDAAATILTADELGSTAIEDVEQSTVDRFVPVVIQQRDANGAQALGWYAFNTCQFIIAEEWFISSSNWVPTEAAMYGLALTRLRLGDQEGFEEIVAEWGDLYRSVRGLATGEDLDPADPVTGGSDDPTDEVGVESVICDPVERERLQELIATQQGDDDLTFTEAGSLTSVPAIRVNQLAHRPDGAQRPAMPRRSVVIRPGGSETRSLLVPVQATVPLPSAPSPAPIRPAPVAPVTPAPNVVTPVAPGRVVPPAEITSAETAGGRESVIRQRALGGEARFRDTRAETTVRRRRLQLREGEDARPVQRRSETVTAGGRTVTGDTVQRRVRGGATTTASSRVDAEVERIVNRGPRYRSAKTYRSRPVRSRRVVRSGGGGGGGSGVQQALSGRNYTGCVAATNRAIRNGTLSGADAAARGFCLLQLNRPVEAAQAFQLAKGSSRYGSSARADAAYGAALAALATNNTGRAAIEAASVPQSRGRRTELQTAILTQRAVDANRNGRYAEAVFALNERNKIAPLQKDLMLLQGFAYRNAGDLRSARRLIDAVNRAGPTSATMRAANDIDPTVFIGQMRGDKSFK